jgi:hypothetical protein
MAGFEMSVRRRVMNQALAQRRRNGILQALKKLRGQHG